MTGQRHREMGLFAIDAEYVGPGLPLWLPKGTVLVEELEKLAKESWPRRLGKGFR
jgi:threonyl-tRNA synthetase